MTDDQKKMIKETLDMIASCTNTISEYCTKEIAPNDPVAAKCCAEGNFPDWLPDDMCKKFDQMWDLSKQIKSIIKIANDELKK